MQMVYCILLYMINIDNSSYQKNDRGPRGRDRMAVGFTISYAIGAYHH